MTRKSPDPVDIHVGARVRMRRLATGVSQEKLGERLGLTFQQIQKYEKGTNRIGASRLQQISEILQVPVSFLFEGASTAVNAETAPFGSSATFMDDFLASREGVMIAKGFAHIKDPQLRGTIARFVREIGLHSGNEGSGS